jgi:hypothetical protein
MARGTRGVRKKREIDWGAVIAGSGLVIGIPRYIAALMPAEPDVMGVSISFFTGIGFALILEGGTFYTVGMAFSAWKRTRKAWYLLLIPCLLLLLLSPIIVTPAITAHLRERTLPQELAAWIWDAVSVWAVVISSAPTVLVAAASLARAFRIERQTKTDDEEDAANESTTAKPKPLTCNWCGAASGASGKPFLTTAAVSAHKRHCPEREGQGNAGEIGLSAGAESG